MTGVFYDAETAYHSRAPWFTPVLAWVRVAHLLNCGCCVVIFFCFVCCRLVCPVFPVSLDCTFMISPSIFPNVNNLMNI